MLQSGYAGNSAWAVVTFTEQDALHGVGLVWVPEGVWPDMQDCH